MNIENFYGYSKREEGRSGRKEGRKESRGGRKVWGERSEEGRLGVKEGFFSLFSLILFTQYISVLHCTFSYNTYR